MDNEAKKLKVCEEAKKQSEDGCVRHVNLTVAGDYYVSEWYCSAAFTVASYENGKKL